MKKDSAIYTKKSVVNIRTGEVQERLTTVLPEAWPHAGTRLVGWHHTDLRADGLPDQRKSYDVLRIRKDSYEGGEVEYRGNYSVHRPEHEFTASLLRDTIAQAKQMLRAAEDALLKYYGDLDNPPA